ncbi:hypothetical protein BA939_19450 [Rhizobium sp. S41]|nr:hypothetical protein BA939_19450 [Rhizobium sp. S41]KGE82444.1 hypothetical protein LW14_10985 [Rhizobium sp. H41]
MERHHDGLRMGTRDFDRRGSDYLVLGGLRCPVGNPAAQSVVSYRSDACGQRGKNAPFLPFQKRRKMLQL